jgi:outer membrane receptor protein involved in Fe transport
MWLVAALLAVALGLGRDASAQGVTTSAVAGRVTGSDGAPLASVEIVATHVPSGREARAVTRGDGRYAIQGLQPGGPYTIRAEGLGFGAETRENITLVLSQTARFDFTLEAQALQLGAIDVSAERGALMSRSHTGTVTIIGDSAVSRLPSLTRDFVDFTRLTPQISTATGGTSAAGRSNRFNNIQIDGAVNNDLFGLGSSAGVPGGSTGARAITLEAIAQFEVVLAPYDVRQGGFTGAGINAITKSGTNDFHGSATFFTRPDALVGRYNLPSGDRGPKVGEFSQYDLGFSLGGPILRDRLHFFVAGENTTRSSPNAGVAIGRDAAITAGEAQEVIDILEGYGYEPGEIGEMTVDRKSLNLFGRLDWSINPDHRLTLRHNRVDAENDELFRSNTAYQLGGTAYVGDHLTNSTVAQLNSSFGNGLFNELRIGYTTIRDERIPSREPFPFVSVPTLNGTINAGTENFSTANALDQNLLELTNDVTFARGRHNFTIGTHNEFFNFDNVFARNLYGNYTFSDVASFQAGTPSRYEYTYLNEGGKPSSKFDVRQLSFYLQDQWDMTDRFTLTGGVRYDVTQLPDEPGYNSLVEDAFQRRTDEVPSGKGLFNPRIGFNWDVTGTRSTQVRGGTGLFSGRTPYVWISNAYGNTGLDYTRFTCSAAGTVPAFVADPFNQPDACVGTTNAAPNEIALVNPDFKLPQVWRSTFAIDQRLPYGFVGTLEALYSKNRHDVLYQELTLGPVSDSVVEGRPVWTRNTAGFSTVTDITNTKRGYSYNLTGQLQRSFDAGFDVSAAYSFTRSRDVTSAISSQAFSSWRRNAIDDDPNDPELRPSNYEVPHRIVLNGSYRAKLIRNAPTDISVIYVGESGKPYSYTYNSTDINNDGSNENDLIYVPATSAEINFAGNDDVSAEQSWENLNSFIEGVECLREARGQVLQRNACREPWANRIDMRLAQVIPSIAGHSVEVSMDIFNFLNLLNRDWGTQEAVNGDRALDPLLRRSGSSVTGGHALYNAFTPRPEFTTSDLNSRYQIQLGVRYAF